MNRGLGTGLISSILMVFALSHSAHAIPGGIETSAYPYVRELLIFYGANDQEELQAKNSDSSCTATFVAARTLVTDAHCVCDPRTTLGVLDPATNRIIRVSRREFIYDIPKRSMPGTATAHCEPWDGPPLDGTEQDPYHGTDADLGVVELERGLTDALPEEDYPFLPSGPNESSEGEYAFVGYGYGAVGWASGGFRFLGEKSVRRTSRIHVKLEQDFDFLGQTEQFKTLLFPGVYLRTRGEDGVDRLVPRSGGGHDLMTAPGDSGGPLLRDGVIWAVVTGFASSVETMTIGEAHVFGVRNYAMSLSAPFVLRFFEQLHQKGYAFHRMPEP